jgi:hypothetical protein
VTNGSSSPAPLTESARTFLNRAQAMLKAGKFEEALRGSEEGSARSIRRTQNVASALRGAETVIISELQEGRDCTGAGAADPPAVRGHHLDGLSLPDEAFLLSRINGIWDVASIVRISPMRESEALLILQRLRRDGIIDLGG